MSFANDMASDIDAIKRSVVCCDTDNRVFANDMDRDINAIKCALSNDKKFYHFNSGFFDVSNGWKGIECTEEIPVGKYLMVATCKFSNVSSGVRAFSVGVDKLVNTTDSHDCTVVSNAGTNYNVLSLIRFIDVTEDEGYPLPIWFSAMNTASTKTQTEIDATFMKVV